MLGSRRVREIYRASIVLRYQFYFLLVEFAGRGTREEEELRSDDQEQENIDDAGEVEHCGTKKHGRRWYMVVSEV